MAADCSTPRLPNLAPPISGGPETEALGPLIATQIDKPSRTRESARTTTRAARLTVAVAPWITPSEPTDKACQAARSVAPLRQPADGGLLPYCVVPVKSMVPGDQGVAAPEVSPQNSAVHGSVAGQRARTVEGQRTDQLWRCAIERGVHAPAPVRT